MFEGLALAFAAAFVGSVLFLAIAAVRIVRSVRRSPRIRLATRTVRYWQAPPGPRRQASLLRRDLARNVVATRHAVDAVAAADGAVGELPYLVRRLERVAEILDVELGILETEPDGTEIVATLPAAEQRVDDVARVGRMVRRAASAGLSAQAASSLPELIADVDHEVTALAAGIETLLSSSDPGRAARQTPRQRPA